MATQSHHNHGKDHDHKHGHGHKHEHGHGEGHGHGCGHGGGHSEGHGHHPHRFAPEIGREVDQSWLDLIVDLVDAKGKDVVDLGCGAGVYARGWLRLGAAHVTGVDPSEESLEVARKAAESDTSTFIEAEAADTGLAWECADIVFIRAALHHLDDHEAFADEAARLLRPGGMLIIQDWTKANHAHPASNQFPLGHQMEILPNIREHRDSHALSAAAIYELLEGAGFSDIREREAWEVRYTYPTREAYIHAVRDGGERRFLRHNTEEEIIEMIEGLRDRLSPGEVVDQDHWTIWTATKPVA